MHKFNVGDLVMVNKRISKWSREDCEVERNLWPFGDRWVGEMDKCIGEFYTVECLTSKMAR